MGSDALRAQQWGGVVPQCEGRERYAQALQANGSLLLRRLCPEVCLIRRDGAQITDPQLKARVPFACAVRCPSWLQESLEETKGVLGERWCGADRAGKGVTECEDAAPIHPQGEFERTTSLMPSGQMKGERFGEVAQARRQLLGGGRRSEVEASAKPG